MCLGDSYTAAANADPTHANSYAASWVNQLAALLRSPNQAANCNSAFGHQFAFYNGSPYQNNEDPRLIYGGSATTLSNTSLATNSIGGPMVQFPGAASTLTWNIPAGTPVDTVKCWYAIPVVGTVGNFQWKINGGAYSANVPCGVLSGNPSTMGSFTATGALGATQVNVNWINGYCNFAGFESYNSTVKEIQLMNCGWPGAKTGDWVDTTYGYSPGNAISFLNPDLTIICLGLNDLQQGVSVATYAANLQTIINSAKATGDVLLVTGGPWDPVGSGVSYAVQQGYWSAMHQLAVLNNLRIVDMFTRWGGDLTAAAARGLEASGSFNVNSHPSAVGHQDYAANIFNAIGRM